MKVRFCGATTGVTGSCHMLFTERHKILLDCGQYQGGKEQDKMNYEEFPFDPAEIEALILSHAHIDHCGRIPLLVKRGFTGKIYCTKQTADLLPIMLRDSAYIHEKEAEWKNRKAQRSGGKLIEPLYTEADAEASLALIAPVLYEQLIDINDEMRICFNDAGHILGSAITEIWVKEGDIETKVVFSGDLGVKNRPILRDRTAIKKANYVIMESTYGNRLHPENSLSVSGLLDAVLRTVERGGTVVIPSFAVGRTQELIFEFNKFYDNNPEIYEKLKNINVYIDSPMANRATEVFKENTSVFDDEAKEYIKNGDHPLEFANLKFTKTTEESQRLNFDKSPKIIISASGMCEAGRIRHHLKHNLWNPKSTIIFVGYQAENTLGRKLIEGADMVTLFGEQIAVKAEIVNLEGFSGHADRDGLVDWISSFETDPTVFLVHGEDDAKRDFAEYLGKTKGISPIVVNGTSEFDLQAGGKAYRQTSGNEPIKIREGEYVSDTVKQSGGTVKHAEAAAPSKGMPAKEAHYQDAPVNGAPENTAPQNDAFDDGIGEEQLENMKKKIWHIKENIGGALDNANIAAGKELSQEQLIKINNIIQEIDADTANLMEAVIEPETVDD